MAQDCQGVEDIHLAISVGFTAGVQWRYVGYCQVLGVVLQSMVNESHGVL